MALFRVSNERAQFDAAGNDARDQYGAGIRFTQGGNARITTGSATNYNQGIPMSATGQVAIVDATAGLPAGTIFHNGLPISGDKVCVSRNATAVVSNGTPYDSAGAVAADINLDLNFIGTDTLNSSITFTRASSATFVGSNGLIQTATTNTPRFDYDPVTLAAKGLLIEEQRTNLLTYSEQFDNAAWTKVAGSVSVSQNAVGPNGVSNSGATVTALAGTNNHWLYQSFASTAIAYSQSVYAKAGTASWIGIGFGAGATTDGVFFNLSNGTVGTAAFGSTGNIQNVGNGWYRCTVTRTGTGGTYFGALEVHTADNQALNWNAAGTETILVFGLNMEAGSFATSYIPTVASQVTRSADVASVNTLSPWYNATEGTLYAEAISLSVGTHREGVATFFQDSLNHIGAGRVYAGGVITSFYGLVYLGGVTQAYIAAGTITAGTAYKIAFGLKTNDVGLSVNGGAVVTDSSASLPSGVSVMRIGQTADVSERINGHIRRITYYPRRLSNAELQAITA